MTLFDSKDSVLNALKSWDAQKKAGFSPKIYDCLSKLDKACKKLIAAKTTSKTLHKETIKYLEFYSDFAKGLALRLKKAENNDELYQQLKQQKLPKSILAQFSKSGGTWSEAWNRQGGIIEGLKFVKAKKVPKEYFFDCNEKYKLRTPAASEPEKGEDAVVDPSKLALLAKFLMAEFKKNEPQAKTDCMLLELHLIITDAASS